MGTAISERFQVAAGRGRPLEDGSDFSSVGDTKPSKQALADGEEKLHPSENGRTAEESGPACPCHDRSLLAAECALVCQIIAGHKELFMDLIRPYERTVYAMVFSLLANKEDAEDVAQEAFVKALAGLGQFRGESSFGTWLIQIAINGACRMRSSPFFRLARLSR